MKRLFFLTAVAGALLMTSCQTTNTAFSPAKMEGEWNITEINGAQVSAQPYPYIGFDTQEGRVYGNSGCNRLTGTYTLKGKKGRIELSQMASTMMACENMDLEQKVLKALGETERISAVDDDHLVLSGKNKMQIVRLEKRFRIVPLSDIRGEWRIVSVFGEKLTGLEKDPTVTFDTDKMRLSAYAGCNRLSASFTKGDKSNSISIPRVMSTRMACPDMTAEQNTITALEQVRSYGISNKGNLLLFSAGGNQVMELMRYK